MIRCLGGSLTMLILISALPLCARAQGVAPSPAPSAAPADPCGGPQRLLATLNRPTIGYSPCAVAPGSIVFEEGYQAQENGTNARGASILDQYPQSFIRYGVSSRFEADLIGPNDNHLAGRADGFSDSGVGFKYEFVPRGHATVGIDGLFTSPNGSRAFTTGVATQTVNLDLSYGLTGTLAIGTTLSAQATGGLRADGTPVRYGVFEPSVVLTDDLPHALQAYGEYVYVSKIAPASGGRAFVDGGFQQLLGERFEVDVEAGQSLTPLRAERFHYLGVGFGLEIR
jgi:hypothetical protein